mmetsp:Transcript_15903/g.39324  ORF Transcript_15903/g.39324 Transcript_15903/m.39324 type:complete len:334 (+) Transcript_15903:17546-18547(+)
MEKAVVAERRPVRVAVALPLASRAKPVHRTAQGPADSVHGVGVAATRGGRWVALARAHDRGHHRFLVCFLCGVDAGRLNHDWQNKRMCGALESLQKTVLGHVKLHEPLLHRHIYVCLHDHDAGGSRVVRELLQHGGSGGREWVGDATLVDREEATVGLFVAGTSGAVGQILENVLDVRAESVTRGVEAFHRRRLDVKLTLDPTAVLHLHVEVGVGSGRNVLVEMEEEQHCGRAVAVRIRGNAVRRLEDLVVKVRKLWRRGGRGRDRCGRGRHRVERVQGFVREIVLRAATRHLGHIPPLEHLRRVVRVPDHCVRQVQEVARVRFQSVHELLGQ